MDDWSLHPQLAKDTSLLADLALSRALIMNDANYPWVILVPRRLDITELIDLAETEHAQLLIETTSVARALRAVTACHKLNIAALGNAVPQLHVHIIARFPDDAAWPKPVWGVAPPRDYHGDQAAKLAAALRERIARK
jgi:diadenosine tetraphosphate (Ap4A) HIT family hydrolase